MQNETDVKAVVHISFTAKTAGTLLKSFINFKGMTFVSGLKGIRADGFIGRQNGDTETVSDVRRRQEDCRVYQIPHKTLNWDGKGYGDNGQKKRERTVKETFSCRRDAKGDDIPILNSI